MVVAARYAEPFRCSVRGLSGDSGEQAGNQTSNLKRQYGSLTTSDILFKNKDDQFRTGAVVRPSG
jgi:hypothetical protein